MCADYSFEVKNIEIWVPAFFKHNNSSLATVSCIQGSLSVAQLSDHLRSTAMKIAFKATEAKSCKTSNKHPKGFGK